MLWDFFKIKCHEKTNIIINRRDYYYELGIVQKRQGMRVYHQWKHRICDNQGGH